MPADRPPNILFLMSDEHRPDVAGFAGNAVVRTPVLDELARTGTVFTHAYTPSPICIPGRQAMMAGQLPRTCGCEYFGQDLPPGSMTFAQRLSQWAYATMACGKLHHVGRDQMQGWTRRAAPDMFVNEAFIRGRHDPAFEKYPPRHPRWKWPDVTELHRARPAAHSRNQVMDRRATQAADDFIEDYFVDMTYDRAQPDRPLLLKHSLIQPHYPYVTERDKLAYYFNRVEPFIDEPVFDHPFLSQRSIEVGFDQATEREVRRATAAYYGMIETVDGHFGEVLDALRRVGQNPDDWVIIYTSDHGEMLGEHGVWEKQKFFEASVRVPLVIRWPRRFKPGVVTENVNLCDLFATICEVAQVPLPPDEQTVGGRGLDSRSLIPLMRGDTDAWHARWHNETVSQFGGTNLMIKRDALKYQFYGDAMPEVLFDLGTDPAERQNLIDDPRYAQQVETFRRRRGALGFGPDADTDYRNAGY